MDTSEPFQIKEAIKLSPEMQWVNDNFVQNQPKCVQQNHANSICSQKKCQKQNPFICNKGQCKCQQWHLDCNARNIKSFLKEFQSRNDSFSTQLQNNIEQSMDRLIEAISIAKQSFLERIRQRKGNQLLLKNKQARKKYVDGLIGKKLTGSIVSSLSSTSQENKDDIWLEKFNNQFTQIFKQFERIKLSPFLSHAEQVLFSDVNKVNWSKNLSYGLMIIKGKCIKHSFNNSSERKIGLIEPGISKLSGTIIRWKIKITSLINYNKVISEICLGICFRQSIKKKRFVLKERNDECYMISNLQKIYDALDFQKNQKNGFGIQFLQNDIIEMQLDKIKWVLKFENLRTSKSTKIKITKIPQPNEDDYHICVALNNSDDQVEIISPIETSLGEFQVS